MTETDDLLISINFIRCVRHVRAHEKRRCCTSGLMANLVVQSSHESQLFFQCLPSVLGVDMQQGHIVAILKRKQIQLTTK